MIALTSRAAGLAQPSGVAETIVRWCLHQAAPVTSPGHQIGPVFAAINSLARRTDDLHTVALTVAEFGPLAAVVLVLAAWRGSLTPDRARVRVLWAAVSTLLAAGVNLALMHLFRQLAPAAMHPHLVVLAPHTAVPSYPGTPAVIIGALAAGTWLNSRRWGIVAALAAGGIAFSEVYIGAHYPHDVLVGLTLGAAVTLGGWQTLDQTLGWLRPRLDNRVPASSVPAGVRSPHPTAANGRTIPTPTDS